MRALHVCLIVLVISFYDFQHTSVHSLTSLNFDQQITSQRRKLAGLVHFFRPSDSHSPALASELTTLAKDWQGAFAIAAVNCELFEALCELQEVRETPSVRVYPPLPGPVHEYEGEESVKGLLGHLAMYLGAKVTEVTLDSEAGFRGSRPGVPKVLLFTEKAGIPTIYKALCTVLGDTLDFGIVRSDQTALISSYEIPSFPRLVLLNSDGKVQPYDGEMKFRSLFEFLNIYSEVFVTGGSAQPPAAPKPWRTADLPELTQASASDLCFDHENALCAIFISSTKPEEDQISLFKTLQDKFGIQENVTFMWLNGKIERDFLAALEGISVPALVFVKPGNRSKYARHTGVLSIRGVEIALGKLKTEDRFKQAKGKFPKFAYRK